ncbi:MAG TPA: ATP-binding cassette domain-containing protein, partial [Verrucomicrobiae bacterium]|nr:ATP-binding cassette domain-containing protein [Verrucomicrobiae bacterium]
NGAGKSTLMKVLAGEEFQAGDRVAGHNVVMDYFAQDQAKALEGTRSAYDELLADAPYHMVPKLRDILGAFLFSGDDIHKRVGVLSGGEKNRLALAKMLLRPSNLLLMDEPTNHLDLFSKEVLLDALRSYSGTVVFVSHDRHFIDGLATRVVEVGEGRLASYHGDYEYYLSKKAGTGDRGPGTGTDQGPGTRGSSGSGVAAAGSGLAPRPDSPAPLPPMDKESRLKSREEEKRRQRDEKARRKRAEEIESEIHRLEKRLEELEREMADPAYFADPDRARAGGEEHASITDRIEALYAEWEAVQ